MHSQTQGSFLVIVRLLKAAVERWEVEGREGGSDPRWDNIHSGREADLPLNLCRWPRYLQKKMGCGLLLGWK